MKKKYSTEFEWPDFDPTDGFSGERKKDPEV